MWQIETGLPIRLAVMRMAGVIVSGQRMAFEKLQECAEHYLRRYGNTAISSVPNVQHGRKLFHAIGQDPTKRRPSSEALLNRALKGKELFAINTLVDLGNWCSLDFLLPICLYDAELIFGEVTVRRGRPGECFLGHNDQMMSLENRYVIADDKGPFGSPITDAKRAAVSDKTQNAFLVIFAPQDYEDTLLQQHATLFADRTLEICSGRMLEHFIL